jgi:hypothetical protein
MSAASFVAIFGAVCVGVAAALFLTLMAASQDERNRRRARARDLARYRHHPDANLLSLND